METKNHSGKKARDWRSTLGASHIRSEKPVRTLQFPLDHEPLSKEFVKNAQDTFITVRGEGDGSLTKLVQTMLLCGFRIVTNKDNAEKISSNVKGSVAFQVGGMRVQLSPSAP